MTGSNDAKRDAVRRVMADLVRDGAGLPESEIPRAIKSRLRDVALGEADIRAYAEEVKREIAKKR